MARPTLADVAKRAKVAIMTASRALRGETSVRPRLRERVLAAARALDYQTDFVARAMTAQRQRLVTCSVTDINNPYFGKLADCLFRTLAEGGYHTLFSRHGSELAELTIGYRASGSIMMIPSAEHVNAIARSLPVVSIGATQPEKQRAPDIYVDLPPAYRELGRRLLAQGRKRLGWYCEPIADRNNRHKFELASETFREGGTVVEPPEGANASPATLAEAVSSKTYRVDALVCKNDLTAVRAMLALQRAGVRCPEDVRLVGCDGVLEFDGLWTIRIDVPAIARGAVDLLMRQIDGQRVTSRLLLAAELLTPH